MKRGEHAAEDGSFGRSAGGAMARGIALIVAAVVIGLVLLNATDAPEPLRVSSDETPDAGPTGTQPTGTTTTTAPTGSTDTTATAVAARPPAEVTVLVANAARVQGAAGKLSAEIAKSGFKMTAPANGAPVPTSTVYFVEGYEPEARAVAALLTPAPPVAPMPAPAPVDDLRGANVVVVQGPDLAQ